MIKWLSLTDQQRKISIEQAAVRSGITAKAIEKDWWITLMLKAIFESSVSEFCTFRGGTSLSKGWFLIQRFSEDVDIALAPEAFGKTYKVAPSHSYVKQLKKEGCQYTSTTLKDALLQQLIIIGLNVNEIEITSEDVLNHFPDKDPQTLYVKYRSLYPPHPYLADVVKLEFSVRSLKEPFSIITLQSILFKEFPNKAYEEAPFNVQITNPNKTMLEKIFLLHEKFCNPNALEIQSERQSRHLYDIVKMMDTEIEEQVTQDKKFYQELIEHRRSYVRLKNVNYDDMQNRKLTFLPSPSIIESFRKDYEIMQQAMIYGESPDFDTIIDKLKLLNEKLLS